MSSGFSGRLRDVTYGSAGFLALGEGGAILRSDDGLQWTEAPSGEPHLSSIRYGNGRYVAIGGFGSRVVALTSVDAIEWQRSELSHFTSGTGLSFDGARFLAAGADGTILSSLDGVTWTLLVSASPFEASRMEAVANDGRVAVGKTGVAFQREETGEWASVRSGTSRSLWDLATHDDVAVAVGDEGVILRSLDGVGWETVHASDRQGDLGGVVFGGNVYVAVGSGGRSLRSADGVTWEEGSLPSDSMYWSVAYGDGRFVAVGEKGAVASSLDGLSWSPFSFDEGTSLHAVVFEDRVGFAAAGVEGFLAHSVDGEDWEVVSPVGNQEWQDLAEGTGWLVAVGAENAVAISADGREWHWLAPLEEGVDLRAVSVDEWGAIAWMPSGESSRFPLPPLARSMSADVSASPGEDALIQVETGGTPPFTYSWFHDGQLVQAGAEPFLWLTQLTREAIGEYQVLIENETGEAIGDPVFVSVRTSFAEWQYKHFSEPEDAAAAPGADPGGIGIPNLLFYALELDPETPRADLPVLAVEVDEGEAYLTLTFPQTVGADDVEFLPEVSEDLVEWTPLPAENLVRVERQGSRNLVAVRDLTNLQEAGGKRFLRLRVVLMD